MISNYINLISDLESIKKKDNIFVLFSYVTFIKCIFVIYHRFMIQYYETTWKYCLEFNIPGHAMLRYAFVSFKYQ